MKENEQNQNRRTQAGEPQDNRQNEAGSEPNWDALGRDIEKQVNQAVSSIGVLVHDVLGDVQQNVRNNVGSSVQDVGKSIREVGSTVRDSLREAAQSLKAEAKAAQNSPERQRAEREKRTKRHQKSAKSAEEGGFVMLFVAAIMAALTVAGLADGEGANILVLLIMALFFAASGISSVIKGRRLRRLACYLTAIEGRTYCTDTELASAIGKNQNFVREDLKKFMRRGELLGMNLTPDGTHLFASPTAYRLHMAQQSQPHAHVEPINNAPIPAQEAPQPEKPTTVLDECRAFAALLHRQNELIDEPMVSDQVTALERHTGSICNWLEHHSGQENQVKRFAGYYLPTTLKLLETYNELDPHATDSKVAADVQKNIVDILHTINTAFQTLEDGLIKDTALNVSTEITVLESMLTQDGLMDDGMRLQTK